MVAVCHFGSTPDDAFAQAQDDLMEVFWEFKYTGGVNTIIGSRFDGEKFHLSLADLFGAFQVNVIQEPEKNMARGFYLTTARQYEIDFNAGRALLGNTEIRFDSTEFVKEELGFFLTPELFQRLFNLSITLDERTLIMRLDTPDEMPVVAEQRRRVQRVIRDDATFVERHAPLLFDRRRTLFTGGVVGYRLSTQLGGSVPRAAINLRGGGELVGGDLQIGASSSYSIGAPGQDDFNIDVDSWRWRYVMRGLPALRQIQVGELSSDGLGSFSYVGARISNDPPGTQRFFGSYPMQIESEPGWEVELYLNNQLMEVHTADASGIVTFAVPITYGSTTATVREYGPSGEYRETERRIQVPFSFVPPGEIRYNVFAGKGQDRDRHLIQATTSVGITNWLTAKWGFDYVTPDTSISGEHLANLSWGSLSARLGPSYIFTLTGAPGANYTVTASAFLRSLASISLEFTEYGSNRIYNRSGLLRESRASLNLPFRLVGMPTSMRTSLSGRARATDDYFFSGRYDLFFSPGVFRLNLGVRSDFTYVTGTLRPRQPRVEPRIGYSFARSSSLPKPLRGLLVSVRSSYDVQNRNFLNLSADVSRTIAGVIRLQSDFRHQFQTQETEVSVRLALNLRSFRSTSGAKVDRRSASFTQDLSGAVSYDVGSRRINAADTDWVGGAAATVRMFVDYDGNGKPGKDEPTVEHGSVDMERTASTRQQDNGYVIIYNLQAYEQYNLKIDQSRVRNPFWKPKFEEFSFVADPNVHKVINVPFLVAGEITGSVLRETDSGFTAVPGLKLHIERSDGGARWEESVFSDGTFYRLGVLPGDYRVWVDSSQMSILRTASDPPEREFTVGVTELGDVVEDINFVLKDSAAVPSARRDEEQPEAPADEQDARIEVVEPEERQERAEPEPPPKEATIYIVKPGFEGLKELARMIYGDESLWPKIWLANSDLIEDPSDLESGMRLTIPDKTPLTALERAAGDGYQQRDAGGEGDRQTIHTLKSSDSGLMALARSYYGNGFLWPKIWVANRDVLPNPDRLEQGIDLVIPQKAPLTNEEQRALRAYEQGILTWDAPDTTRHDQPQAPVEEQPITDESETKDSGRDDRPIDSGAEDSGLTTHTVTRDDVSLMNLARKYYGDWTLWPKIWVANRDVLPVPEKMSVGMKLTIPSKGPLTPEEIGALEEYNRQRGR